jgi:hypothetical protein
MVRRGLLGAVMPLAALIALPAHAQDAADSGSDSGAGWELPRHQMAGMPSGAPTTYDCKKKACIFLVNLSNHRVTEFRYAVAEKNGAPQWSGNAFPSNFAFNSKRWTMWFPPKAMGCQLDLKVVMTIDGKDHEESGKFDVCANPTLLFTIRDPLEKDKFGRVTVDPVTPNAPTPTAKP